MKDSHTIITSDSTADEWAEFRRTVSATDTRDLTEIARLMNLELRVDEATTPPQFVDILGDGHWDDFVYAYERTTRQSLDVAQ